MGTRDGPRRGWDAFRRALGTRSGGEIRTANAPQRGPGTVRSSVPLMHAITIPEPGGPEALVWTEVPDPEPGEGEVLIEVAASAVNRADLLQRQGFYDPPPGTSPYPGLECSGRIAALGPGVSGWSVGDEVCALLSGGGYAEKVTAPVGQLLPIPAGVDLVAAAALPEAVCTVWSNLFWFDGGNFTSSNVFMIAHLSPGETLLVHGGSSGIGTMAIQLAKAVGARVAVTAGTKEKLDQCAELGADILINYREQDFVEEIKRATDGKGAEVILDIMGAKYLDRNVKALAANGRLAIIGLQGGVKGELNIGVLLSKRAAISATTLRARPLGEKAAIVAAVREHVWPLVSEGHVRPVVDRELPMSDAATAHRVLEESGHIGKVLLVASGG
jgi:putative PIG3 family NAD(P)H quinone oxidoreductase